MSVGHSRLTSRSPSPHHCGRVGEQLLQLALHPLLLQRAPRVELVLDVGEHLGDRDLQALLLAALAHAPARSQAPVSPSSSSITVGAAIQFSGLTFEPPPSAQTMNVPSALTISSRTASGRTVLRRPA